MRLALIQELVRYWGSYYDFAAWEQPELFCAEMRAAFQTLR